MINALALNLIADVMNWDTEEATREYAWLRLMSAVKYDGYSDFRAGVRFLESLSIWLRQFKPADRAAAYDFVKTSGRNLRVESVLGFRCVVWRASLAHANRNFDCRLGI